MEKFIPQAFLIFLFLFIILTIFIYKNISGYRESIGWVNHTNEVLDIIDEINLSLNQMHLSRRGYIVKNDNKFLSDYNDKKKLLNDDFIKLRALTKDNPDQNEFILRMDSLVGLIVTELDSSVKIFSDSKIPDNSIQSRIETVSQDYLDKLFFTSMKSKDEEKKLLNIRRGDSEDRLLRTQIFIIGTSLFVFIVLGLSLYISSRLIKNKNIAEQLLKKSYNELEEKVEARTAELKSSNENLIREIESRIKVENTLRESEQRFKVMADSAPVMIWMSEKSKLYTYFNKGWLNFTGRTLKQELDNGWAEGIHPDDLDRCHNIYNSNFDKREIFEMEFRLRNASGDYRWVNNRGVPRYVENEFAGYIGSCIDIHDKKNAEMYLKIQYLVSKSLAESITIKEAIHKVLKSICSELGWGIGIIWMVEGDKLIRDTVWTGDGDSINQYPEINENYTIDKGSGLPGSVWKFNKSIWVQDIRYENNFPQKEEILKLGWKSSLGFPILGGNDVVAVIEGFCKDEVAPNEELLRVLETAGSQIGNFLERKKVEEKLKNSYDELENNVKERTSELANTLNRLLAEIKEKEIAQNRLKLFAHAIRGVKECIFITDLQNNTIFVNSAFEFIYGFLEEELLYKKIPVLFSSIVDDSLRKEILENSLKGGWKGELKNQRKDGSEFYIYLSTTVIRDDEGKVQALVGVCQDISETREAKEKIRRSEEQLRLIMESIKDYAIITLDKDGFIKSWNYAAKQITGYGREEIIGKHFSIFYPKEEIENNEPYQNLEMARSLDRFAREGWRIRKDGSRFWADITFTTLYDEQGELNGFVKITRDMTEQKKAREALMESEHRLKEAQKIASLGSWEWYAEQNKVIWSDEMYKIFEIEPDTELTYEKFLSLLDEQQNQLRNEVIEKAAAGNKHFKHYLRINTKSGKAKVLDSTGEVYTDDKGKITRIFGTIFDVTSIKNAEEVIRKSESQLKEAQKIAKLGSWEADLLTGEIQWSDEMYRIFELDKDFTIRKFEDIKFFIFPEDLDFAEKTVREFVRSPHDMELDFRIVTSGARLKYLASDIRVVFDSNHKPVKIYGSTQDITDNKLAEEELKRANKKLIEAQKELVHKEKLAALGRFSSGIAHEIRNPLANISALAQLLSRADINDEKMKKHLKHILINSDIANNIIKQLLQFASHEDLILSRENLSAILENIVSSVEQRCIENKVLIIKQINIDSLKIYLDKTKLEAALLNFLSNSIDAMPEGGNLTIKANKSEEFVLIDIIDTGCGIESENLDKIFEPFFTTKEAGTGLGLALAYSSIKLHNGILNISSEQNKGTHIEIKLPIKENNYGENTNN